MNFWMRIAAGLAVWVSLAAAQVIPDRYVVELMEVPLGAAVRTKGKAALADRHRAILTEQSRMKSAIEGQRGQVIATTDSLMNALIVKLPGQDAATLATMPGVKKVYPVHLMKATLDRALALHHVPAAWALIGGPDRAGAGIKIAILDTGISPKHPGFQDPTLKFPAGFPRGSSEKNLALTSTKIIVARSYEDIYELEEPDDAQDRNGHGTAVAMAAAGVTNKGPLATITGVAPKAWIGGYKIAPLNEGSASEDAILKALDDALSDGMDVINLSFGSAFQFSTGPDYLPGVAFDRLKNFGVMVVVAAGNAGPGLNTISDVATQSSVISVGAIRNDRVFGNNVIVGGATYRAYPGSGPTPPNAVTGTVLDVEKLDPTGFACSALPEGSASNQVVLILRGVCTFEQKAQNALAGGAVAAIIYTDAARPDAFTPAVGTATLPVLLVSYSDGIAIKTAAQGTVNATLPFKQVTFDQDPRALASFTSLGPTYEFRIKPDLSAAGSDIYTAAQSLDPEGDSYSKDGYQVLDGTSFASPIVAGAAAVLRGARPGLTVDQYDSLLINGATPIFINGGQVAARVQQTGTGSLNLEAAMKNTVTVFPTSLTYGVGSGVLRGALSGHYNQLAVTNIGKTTETFKIRSIPYDSAPALQFSDLPGNLDPKDSQSMTLLPGQTKTVYAYWTAQLAKGEYQGQILVESPTSAVLTPYWYAAPSLLPKAIFELNPPGSSARAGTTVNVYVRVVDETGYPLTTDANLRFTGAASPGAAITLSPGTVFPNLRVVQLRLAPTARANTFTFSFGGAPPITHTITGTTSAAP